MALDGVDFSAMAAAMAANQARVGWIKTDATNKYPLAFFQTGRRVEYNPASGKNLTAYPTVNSGNSTGIKSLASFIPVTSRVARLIAYFAATNPIQIGNDGGVGLCMFDSGSGPGYLRTPFEVATATMSVNVLSSGSSSNITALGWEDNL